MSNEILKAAAIDNWGLLRAGVEQGVVQLVGGLEVPTIATAVFAAGGQVRLAIGQSGEARVLLPLGDGETPETIHEGTGLSISVSSYNHQGRALRFLDLICLSPDLETVFGEVVDEMLARIARGDGCVVAAQSTINDFRSLLLRSGSGEVDRRRIAGLIAELLVLNRLLERSSSAWKAWSGPVRDRHDFRNGDTSLEVKASLRPDASTITINGLEQLEAPKGGTLHLLRMVLEPVKGGVFSVSDLAKRALSNANDPEKLGELLAAVGCIDIDSERWNRHRFRMESERLYEVRPSFPRLTMSMLTGGVVPHGVHNVVYQVDLSAADPFLCEATILADLEVRLTS